LGGRLVALLASLLHVVAVSDAGFGVGTAEVA
jgi:hypothetical protein